MRKNKGITLIALIITVILLLILAGISILALTNTGLFARAEEAKTKTEEKAIEENGILNEYEQWLVNYTEGGTSETPSNTINPATNITEAQSDDMLTKTVNSSIEDANGNKIVIPAGFKILVDDTTNNATTVDKGIVIVDSDENEFVWIPVGTIYTDTAQTEENAITIELNRYTFDSDGTPTAQDDAVIESYYQELATSTGNTTAKDIEAFKTSVTTNGGYYIGRYEARTETERSSSSSTITTVTENVSQFVYNYVSQTRASSLCREMYTSDKFTSDLMNSYAWDTAILFLQSCGTNSKYSKQNSINSGSLATKGTNNQEEKDVQCNIYDMASNIFEWTTETSSSTNGKGTRRGHAYSESGNTSYRYGIQASYGYIRSGFRPIIYII